jgi:hypothetical protein
MNQNLELKLQAWLDGELSDAESQRISERLEANADATQLVAELRSLKAIMAGNELAMTVPDSREFYWGKIQREIEHQARSPRPVERPAVSAWVRWLSPISGFAALACIVLMATRHTAAPTFDEISSTGEGMEAVTFHDQTAGMTVVWLADTSQPPEQAQISETPKDTTTTATPATPDPGDTDVEME